MNKKLLIICETGISAALLVSKTLEEINNQSLDIEVDYAQTEKLPKKLSQENYDVFVLTPQVFAKRDEIDQILNENDVDGKIIEMGSEEMKYKNVANLLKKVEN